MFDTYDVDISTLFICIAVEEERSDMPTEETDDTGEDKAEDEQEKEQDKEQDAENEDNQQEVSDFIYVPLKSLI